MKQILFQILLFLFFTKINAEDRPGYYIPLTGDTIKTIIKRGGVLSGWDSDYRSVTIRDSISGKTKTFLPGEIKGYGFYYDTTYFHFVTKPVKSGEKLFLTPSFIGNKISLYYYEKTQSLGYGITRLRFFTLEDEKGQYLFVQDFGSLRKISENMKSFYKNEPAVVAFIDTKFQKGKDIWKDILAVVEFVNKHA